MSSVKLRREIYVMSSGQEVVSLVSIPIENTEVVLVNGLGAYPGAEYDYVLDGNEITFTYPLAANEVVMITYDSIN